jgi:hypothetical protein
VRLAPHRRPQARAAHPRRDYVLAAHGQAGRDLIKIEPDTAPYVTLIGRQQYHHWLGLSTTPEN